MTHYFRSKKCPGQETLTAAGQQTPQPILSRWILQFYISGTISSFLCRRVFIVKFHEMTLCWCVWEYSTLLQVMSRYLRYSQTGYQVLPHLIKGHYISGWHCSTAAGETAARWRRARGRCSSWSWASPWPWPVPSLTTICRTSILNLKARACQNLQHWMPVSWSWVSKLSLKDICNNQRWMFNECL